MGKRLEDYVPINVYGPNNKCEKKKKEIKIPRNAHRHALSLGSSNFRQAQG